MHVCTSADLGPDFIAWTATIEGTPVALVTPAAADDDDVRAQVVDLLRQAGIDCGSCTMCPIAHLSTREVS